MGKRDDKYASPFLDEQSWFKRIFKRSGDDGLASPSAVTDPSEQASHEVAPVDVGGAARKVGIGAALVVVLGLLTAAGVEGSQHLRHVYTTPSISSKIYLDGSDDRVYVVGYCRVREGASSCVNGSWRRGDTYQPHWYTTQAVNAREDCLDGSRCRGGTTTGLNIPPKAVWQPVGDATKRALANLDPEAQVGIGSNGKPYNFYYYINGGGDETFDKNTRATNFYGGSFANAHAPVTTDGTCQQGRANIPSPCKKWTWK